MKYLLITTLFLSPLAAKADISISCNNGKIVFGDDDEEAGKGSTPSMGINGKDVKDMGLIFREDSGKYHYIVNVPSKKPETQYTFSVERNCGDGDQKGKLTVHKVGEDKDKDKSYECECDVD
jgi:hypothetical protein